MMYNEHRIANDSFNHLISNPFRKIRSNFKGAYPMKKEEQRISEGRHTARHAAAETEPDPFTDSDLPVTLEDGDET